MMHWLNQLDTELFLLINGLHADRLDSLMVFFSSKWAGIPLYALMLILLMIQYEKRSWRYIIAALVLVAITDLVSVHLFKEVFHRLRPCHEPALAGMVRLVTGKCGGSYGFVSSHAVNYFGLATFSCLVFRKRYRWFGVVFFLFAAIACYSRVYLGVHYPGDVVTGAIIGMLAGWLIHSLGSVTRFLPGKG
jgi:undecaprenyl-diphosphatase